MYFRGFSCILEGDMQKIIANFQQQFGLSANMKDFSKLAHTSDVSTFHLFGCGHSKYALSFKEVQVVYRLFLVNCYLLHGNI